MSRIAKTGCGRNGQHGKPVHNTTSTHGLAWEGFDQLKERYSTTSIRRLCKSQAHRQAISRRASGVSQASANQPPCGRLDLWKTLRMSQASANLPGGSLDFWRHVQDHAKERQTGEVNKHVQYCLFIIQHQHTGLHGKAFISSRSAIVQRQYAGSAKIKHRDRR